ncbi:MAG: GNAT family N-acetyltransferase [Pseudobdellovibrionaceae bacterium]
MIKKAEYSDLEPVAFLFDQYRQFYKQESNFSAAKNFIAERLRNGDSIIFVAYDEIGNEAAGFVQLYPTFSSVSMRKMWILNDLFVSEKFRRNQFAKKLIESCESFGKENKARSLTLKTAMTNAPAQKLYEALGWTKDTEFYSYYKRFNTQGVSNS